MRPSLLAAASLFALVGATGCVVHNHPGDYTYREYRDPGYTYYGAHPIPAGFGHGWCLVEADHVHDYAPDYSYYTYRDSYYVYSGPTVVWYYDFHPIPSGGSCNLHGRHSHSYHPGYHNASAYQWDRTRNVYVYSDRNPHPASGARPPPGQGTGYDPPGHGRPPGHGGTPPGHGGTPPGHGGTPPGHGGGHANNPPPGHGGTPPGHGGTPPGHNDNGVPPGHMNNPGNGWNRPPSGNGNGNGNGRGNPGQPPGRDNGNGWNRPPNGNGNGNNGNGNGHQFKNEPPRGGPDRGPGNSNGNNGNGNRFKNEPPRGAPDKGARPPAASGPQQGNGNGNRGGRPAGSHGSPNQNGNGGGKPDKSKGNNNGNRDGDDQARRSSPPRLPGGAPANGRPSRPPGRP